MCWRCERCVCLVAYGVCGSVWQSLCGIRCRDCVFGNKLQNLLQISPGFHFFPSAGWALKVHITFPRSVRKQTESSNTSNISLSFLQSLRCPGRLGCSACWAAEGGCMLRGGLVDGEMKTVSQGHGKPAESHSFTALSPVLNIESIGGICIWD